MRLFPSSTPAYEGDGQPQASCRSGFLGWLSGLLGFPCTPDYQTLALVYPGCHPHPSDGSLIASPQGYSEQPTHIVIQQQ